ncbi:ABC transporter substrate-binding protein [Actinomadura hibisca]|uniref:ABC transporter substrate-binding protein n=1 Tax=Actinomadura hibisca TaxID=68565 RepID=UPI000832CD88|nr:ABC transporter substrate-binding protein [Actinomadura hibisca]
MVSVRCDPVRPDRPARRLTALLAAVLLMVAGASGCTPPWGDDDARAVPGVTDEPCPNAVNKDNGCIYLGTISDLSSGPFKTLGVPITRAQRAFWDRVNRQGGIGGHDVDVTTYVRDNHYDVRTHQRAYQEIKGRVLALAQTLGASTTEAILGDLRAAKMIAVPASFPSRYEFDDVILESGASYCFHAMNGVDYAVERHGARSVLAVYFEGEYGDDSAAGARAAARAQNVRFKAVQTPQGAEAQDRAVAAILARKPDAVLLATGPAETAAIVGKTVAAGFRGRFYGQAPTYVGALLKSPAGPALEKHFTFLGLWKPFAADSPGQAALRRALGRAEPDDTFTTGWTLSYPLKAALQRAAANGNLTREGLYEAVRQTTFVDYEGIMPSNAGDFSGTPDTAAFRQTVIESADKGQYTGLRPLTDFYTGSTAKEYRLTAPCDRAG